MKFKKITRAASEFIILSILMEKGATHPYQIYQKLQERLLEKQVAQIKNLKSLVKYGTEILNYFKEPKKNKDLENQIVKTIENLDNFFSKAFLSNFLKKGKKNVRLQENLENLIKDANMILNQKGAELETWQKPPAIYQVLKSLEERKLIRFIETEQFQGKNRNLYKITSKGIKEGFDMLTTLGELNQLILPMAKIFQDHIDLQMQNHLAITLKMIKELYPNKNISEILKEIKVLGTDFLIELTNLFPILDNDSLFLPLLFKNSVLLDQIDSRILQQDQESLFKEIVLTKLKAYREHIDTLIEKYEN